MGGWFHTHIVDQGRLPLFCFFAAFLLGFAFIRTSTRLIRARVRWWPGNVAVSGFHVHHVVFGVGFMLGGGVAALSASGAALAAAAAVFGVGAALALDEFALILRLDDVYWRKEGRDSIDAIFAAVAIGSLLLLGLKPVGVDDAIATASADALPHPLVWGWAAGFANLCLAVVALVKGKIWTGLFGLFVPGLALVGAVRLARPASPWARSRYRAGTARGQRKLRRAAWREERLRGPLIRVKIAFQELIAGRPDPES